MRCETILHAGTSLTKPEFGLIKLVPATAKHIGSQSTLASGSRRIKLAEALSIKVPVVFSE
jgi:hypothetical protein